MMSKYYVIKNKTGEFYGGLPYISGFVKEFKHARLYKSEKLALQNFYPGRRGYSVNWNDDYEIIEVEIIFSNATSIDKNQLKKENTEYKKYCETEGGIV